MPSLSIGAIPLPAQDDADFSRADLEFAGVDHSGPSFEARVFLNNEGADEDTELESAAGYAGSFFIFGHGRCYGDEGHCEVHHRPNPFDRRLPHQLTPANKTLIVTDAIRSLVTQGQEAMTVKVVAVIEEAAHPDVATGDDDVLSIDNVSLVTYE